MYCPHCSAPVRTDKPQHYPAEYNLPDVQTVTFMHCAEGCPMFYNTVNPDDLADAEFLARYKGRLNFDYQTGRPVGQAVCA